MNNNFLQGTIPSQFGQLANLTSIYLNNNHLVGTIPIQLRQCPLYELYIGGTNAFCPSLNYSTWAQINDYLGSGPCCKSLLSVRSWLLFTLFPSPPPPALCTQYTCLNGGTCNGNTTSFHCSCPFGYFGQYCESVVECNSNYYKNESNYCVACPTNTTSFPGSTSFYDCVCDTPGFVPDITSQQCYECPINSYVNAETNLCLPCPTNSISNASSVGLQSCQCVFGYTLSLATGVCVVPTCPGFQSGTVNWPTAFAGTNATGVCLAYDFVIVAGHIRNDLSPLLACNLDHTGHHANWGTNYVKCSQPQCLNNFYLSVTGLCIPCPLNTISNAGSTSIFDCTCIAPGFYIDNTATSSCVECAANFYTLLTDCVVCPDRSTSPPGSSFVTDCVCDFGYFLDPSTTQCEVPTCDVETVDNSTWVVTTAGTTAIGACVSGYLIYSGDTPRVDILPTRQCILGSDGASAYWDSVVGVCEETCSVAGCDLLAPCTISADPYVGPTCNCTNTGATGRFCEDDIDTCLDFPCLNGGNCTDTGPGTYSCNCSSTNYEGVNCQVPIDPCLEGPCLNGGVCSYLGANNYTCNCTGTYFNGFDCQSEINSCLSSPCLNGANCTHLGPNKFSCDCGDSGYTGTVCKEIASACGPTTCLNGATCLTIGVKDFYCLCATPNGHGIHCESSAFTIAPSPLLALWTLTLSILLAYLAGC